MESKAGRIKTKNVGVAHLDATSNLVTEPSGAVINDRTTSSAFLGVVFVSKPIDRLPAKEIPPILPFLSYWKSASVWPFSSPTRSGYKRYLMFCLYEPRRLCAGLCCLIWKAIHTAKTE
jgi:hypothetical protein